MEIIHYTDALRTILKHKSLEEASQRLHMTTTTYRNQMQGRYQLKQRPIGHLQRVYNLYKEATGDNKAIDFYGVIVLDDVAAEKLEGLEAWEKELDQKEAELRTLSDAGFNAVMVATQTTSMLMDMVEKARTPEKDQVEHCRKQIERLQERLEKLQERNGECS